MKLKINILMLLYLIFLSFLIGVKATGNTFYPFIIPISSVRDHTRHTTHVFTHPVIRTQVLVLGASDHNPQSNYGRHPHDEEKFQKTYKYPNNEYRDQTADREPRANGLSPTIKYSVPEQQSSWKPVRSIPMEFLPLKYLGEDGPAVAKVVYESMSASKYNNDDEEGPLILPVGIKKLHNPQLRLPHGIVQKHLYGGNTLTEGRHVNDPHIYKIQIGQKGTFINTDHRGSKRIHCHCRIPKV